jgi:hypothetical protein
MFSPMRSQLAKEHQAPRPSNGMDQHQGGWPELGENRQYNIVSNYTPLADGVYCDFDPIEKKADIGSNFLERE